MPKRIHERTKKAICRRFLLGESGPSLAKAYRCSRTSVGRAIAAANINGLDIQAHRSRRAANQKVTREQQIEIAEKYRAGLSLKKLGKHYGVHLEAIRYILIKKGVPRRIARAPFKIVSKADERAMVRLWRRGETKSKIASLYELSPGNVAAVFTRLGVTIECRKPRRELHHNWKGGRIIHSSGYTMVMLERSDPFYEMVNGTGYAMEHRVVMARSLKRLLDPRETVHHIDGNRRNNVLSNLQLRIGRHGVHSVYECAECGSRNIRPARI